MQKSKSRNVQLSLSMHISNTYGFGACIGTAGRGCLYCGNPCQRRRWLIVIEHIILTDLVLALEQPNSEACIAEIHVNVKEGLVIEHIILTDPDLAHGFDYSSQT